MCFVKKMFVMYDRFCRFTRWACVVQILQNVLIYCFKNSAIPNLPH